jgi:hypothetical protein
MKKIKLIEAMGFHAAKTGEQITRIELAEKLWPNSPKRSQYINISRLASGKAKRVDIDHVRIICDTLDVDANFLFDVKPIKWPK